MSEVTNPEMVQKALQRVKELVSKREYDKARAILQRIKHPKQAEWLQRLDASIRREQANAGPKPWNPSFWASMTFVMSPLITSSILGWNWRRFGKKGWTIPTILVSFLLLATTIGVAFSGVIFSTSESLKSSYGTIWIGAVMIFAAINYSFPFMIAGRQSKALKVMEEKGMYAMRAHHYDWGRGFMMWGLNIVVILAIATGVFLFRSGGFDIPQMLAPQPKSFDDGWVYLEYPQSWNEVDVDTLPNCRNNEYIDCRVAILTDWGSTGLAIARVRTWPGINTANDVIDGLWMQIPREDRTERGRYVISGLETKYAKYTLYDNGRSFYNLDFAMVARGQIFYINIITDTEEDLDAKWDEIKAIVDAIVWTP